MAAAIAAGVGGGAAGFFGSLYGASQAKKEAKKQRRFIMDMRATAYQTTMADMKAAGLNPILAYKTGPTPIGSAAAGVTPDFGQAMASGVNSAVRAAKVGKERAGISEKTKLTKAQERTEQRKANLVEFQSQIEGRKHSARAVTNNILANTRETTAKSRLLEAEIPRAEAIKDVDESKAGQFINQGAEIIRRATGATIGRGRR